MGFTDRSARGRGDTAPTRRRRRGGPLSALTAVVGLAALLGVLVLGGYAFWLQRTVATNIEHEDLVAEDKSTITLSPDISGGQRPGQEGTEEEGDGSEQPSEEGETDGEGRVDAEEGTEVDEVDDEVAPIVGDDGEEIDVTGVEVEASVPARPDDAGDALNFLIIGSDSRDLSVERGRSDVIVLAHVDDERERVDLVHFPRDLFVPIAGTGGSSKINASYAYGGAPLLIQTLQPLIGVPIDHVVIVNFESFKAMTDAIGGVNVQVTEAGGGFDVGTHSMDGEQGLRFVRERYSLSQGDISRGERQMQFVKAVLLKALSRETLTNPARLANFVDAATTNLTVDQDLRVGDMRNLALELRGLRGGDIHFWQGPWRGIDMHPVAGSIVLMADQQMATLGEHLRTDTMESYSDPVSPRTGFGG